MVLRCRQASTLCNTGMPTSNGIPRASSPVCDLPCLRAPTWAREVRASHVRLGLQVGRGRRSLVLPLHLGAARGVRSAPRRPSTLMRARSSEGLTAAPERMRVMVSTGDVMGDIHAASFVRALYAWAEREDPPVQLEVVALSGQRTQEAGATLLGLMEALPLVLPSLQLQRQVRDGLRENPPDVAVLLDYPGVNIPFGNYLRNEVGCRVVYYIPPNEWLWNPSRTKEICAMSNAILCNYREEEEYFAGEGGKTVLVGHPLVDLVDTAPSRAAARQLLGVTDPETSVVLLLPASRFQEIRLVWPVIAEAACRMQDDAALGVTDNGQAECRPDIKLQFVLPVAAPHLRQALLAALEESGLSDVLLWEGEQYAALAAADVALTKSGSVNLELALLAVPQVVVYRIDKLTAWIARKVFNFNVPFISLCNLILARAAVPEFVQEAATPQAVADAAMALMPNAPGGRREKVLLEYETLRQSLGSPGVADRAASYVGNLVGKAARES